MTSDQVHQPERLANLIGKDKGLTCRYEWSTRKRKWMYCFYRQGRYIGAVGNPKLVVAKMERFTISE